MGFVDSDDYVDRRMYAAMYTRAGSEELDLVECDFHYLEEDGREKRSYGSAAPWNKLIRRRLLTDNEIWFPEGYIYEDTSFYLKLHPFVKKQAKMLGVYVYHRDRGDSTMNDNKSRRVGNIFPVLQDACRFYREKELMDTMGKNWNISVRGSCCAVPWGGSPECGTGSCGNLCGKRLLCSFGKIFRSIGRTPIWAMD